MVRIIPINGVARGGKDTFAEQVRQHYTDGVVHTYSSVDTVKKAARFFGADEKIQKSGAERELWCGMKDLYTAYNDGPFQEVLEMANRIDAPGQYPVLFAMVREPKEIAKLKSHFRLRCTTVLMVGNVVHIPKNHADENVNYFLYDITIRNEGTLEELDKKAKQFAAYLKATKHIVLNIPECRV